MIIRQVSGQADPAEHQSTLAKVSVVIKLTHIFQCDYTGIFCLKGGAGHQAPRRACCQYIPFLLSPGIRNFSSVSGVRLRAAFCIYWPDSSNLLWGEKPSSCDKMSVVWGMASSACLSMVAGGKKKLCDFVPNWNPALANRCPAC